MVDVVSGMGTVINEKEQNSFSMSGLMDAAKVQSVSATFGIETVRPFMFYTNDSRATTVDVGSRLEMDGRKFLVKATPLTQSPIPPTHYEILCEEIAR